MKRETNGNLYLVYKYTCHFGIFRLHDFSFEYQ